MFYRACWMEGRVACCLAILWSPTLNDRRLCLGCQFSRLPQVKGDPQEGEVGAMVRCPPNKYCSWHMGCANPSSTARVDLKFLRHFLGRWPFFLFFRDGLCCSPGWPCS